MNILAAMMKHETNTFSPVPTPLERFAKGQPEPFYGEEAYAAFRQTGTALAAFIDLTEAAGGTIRIPIAASAPPSGPVEAGAYEAMTTRILEAVKSRQWDAILLDLHGAMVTVDQEDGEGALLAKVRALAPATPIGVALDMHTNLYPAMVDNADVLAGFQTYPHINQYDTGRRAAEPIFAMMAGNVSPTMAWGNRPMLPHVMRQGSDDFPNRELQARAEAMEKEGAIAVSLFTGFPHADISEAGLSCVVVTDSDPALAERFRDELLDFAWRERESFVYQIEPLEESIARAQASIEGPGDGPVILLDHYDNSASGGTMDSTAILDRVLNAGLEDVAVFAIHDPQAVREMSEQGVGAEIEISLGGKTPMPAIGVAGDPITVRGTVRLLSDGRYRNRGPMQQGVLMDMGPSAVLDTGKVEIVVVSRHQEPNDLACFLTLGIDPRQKRYLLLKSRIHYRAAFKPIAREIIECAGVGVCTSDYSQLEFKNVRRPIFPLDLVNEP